MNIPSNRIEDLYPNFAASPMNNIHSVPENYKDSNLDTSIITTKEEDVILSKAIIKSKEIDTVELSKDSNTPIKIAMYSALGKWI